MAEVELMMLSDRRVGESRNPVPHEVTVRSSGVEVRFMLTDTQLVMLLTGTSLKTTGKVEVRCDDWD